MHVSLPRALREADTSIGLSRVEIVAPSSRSPSPIAIARHVRRSDSAPCIGVHGHWLPRTSAASTAARERHHEICDWLPAGRARALVRRRPNAMGRPSRPHGWGTVRDGGAIEPGTSNRASTSNGERAIRNRVR